MGDKNLLYDLERAYSRTIKTPHTTMMQMLMTLTLTKAQVVAAVFVVQDLTGSKLFSSETTSAQALAILAIVNLSCKGSGICNQRDALSF